MEKVYETSNNEGKILLQPGRRRSFSARKGQPLAGRQIHILLYCYTETIICFSSDILLNEIHVNVQVWSSLILYRKILDAIEDNDYDNLTKRAYVGRANKLFTLPQAYTRSLSNRNTKFRPFLTRLI